MSYEAAYILLQVPTHYLRKTRRLLISEKKNVAFFKKIYTSGFT